MLLPESLQQLFKEKNIFVFNLLGSPKQNIPPLETTVQDLKRD